MKGHGFVCYLLLVYIVYISISYLFLGHLVPFLSPPSEMPPRWQLASSPLGSSRGDHHSRMNAINIIQRKRPIRRRRDESGNRLSVPLLSRSFPIVYSSKHVSLRAARLQLLLLIFSTLYFRPESLLLRHVFPRCFVYSHFFPFDRWTHLKIFASFGYRVISFLVDKNV